MTLRQLIYEIDQIGQDRRSLVNEFRRIHGRGFVTDNDLSREARRLRTERGFEIVRRCQACQESLRRYRSDARAMRQRRRVRHYARTGQRLNRESPTPFADGASAIPIGEFKNFQRDACEQMYFLALHPLPSAFDFFCTTYVETRRGCRQELHLHRRSMELTLVLEGQADCVWFQRNRKGTGWIEAGRRTAQPEQAFRIPPGVVHSINNPVSANRNLTVKLTMFIDDRVGEHEPGFQRARGRVEPVTMDSGERRETNWGYTTRFRHAFRDLQFQYRVDVIRPRRSFTLVLPNRAAFLFDGELQFIDRTTVAAGHVLQFPDAGHDFVLRNASRRVARLFSVEGLDHRDFARQPARFPQFPVWSRLSDVRH